MTIQNDITIVVKTFALNLLFLRDLLSTYFADFGISEPFEE